MDYDHFMGEALQEAQKALSRGEFPVGCVMVHGDRIVARGSRKGTRDNGRNELDHAEMVALFQKFFADPANRYWRDSLLAQYTLGC
jgi:tRNA(adenine34) deaminase